MFAARLTSRGQLGVGEAAGVAGLALPVQGHAIAVAREHVPVEAVVGHIELAVGEPPRERRVGPVERLGEGPVPVQFAGAVGPEPEAVGARLIVEFGLRDGGRRELGARREAAVFVQEAVDRGL